MKLYLLFILVIFFSCHRGKHDVENVVPGVDLNIKITQFNHVFLSSSAGAYLFKDNKLIHIF